MKELSTVTSILLLSIIISCSNHKTPESYLQKVLGNLEKIESASYYNFQEAWRPGETNPVYAERDYIEEYNNPADTTIGASYIRLNGDKTQLEFAYDGVIRLLTYHDKNGIIVDDFSNNPYPVRLVSPPFFNYTKNIIRYALTTNDSIQIELNDLEKEYFLRLMIHEDRQVEFFGGPHYVDNPYCLEPLSIYEIWINKSDNLPYRIRREMEHNISASTVSEVVLNTLNINNLDINSYIPEHYEMRKYGEQSSRTHTPLEMEGKPAPDWILNDMNEQPVSLAGLKSKVLLINFTGIGCGPCQAAIPFLKELKNSFNPDDFDLVSIEGWSRKPSSLQSYANKNELNYHFLCATDKVVEDYQSRGVPSFFILDQNRTIRKAIFGYGKGTTDNEITGMIKELLGK
ncbi:MAG: TlpA family protein disulfide reductase [Tannerellaceae bacterium]|nr:TlpA family protein disulfide reductase [Tannerellaceae bacterium]